MCCYTRSKCNSYKIVAAFEELCAANGISLQKECIEETDCDVDFTNQCQCTGTHYWNYHEGSCLYNIGISHIVTQSHNKY